MKVCIEFDEGQYYLRYFRDTNDATRYAATPRWEGESVEVPDHVVEAYRIAHVQLAAISTLLAHYDLVQGSEPGSASQSAL